MQSFLPLFIIIFIDCSSAQFHYPNYKTALEYSLYFYESQRSGHLPLTNRIKWRGDSALNDTGLNGEDLTGGYYDASDFVKFNFNMAFTSTILAWSVILFPKGYIEANQLVEAQQAIKWATDYLIKCHTSKNELYAQIGDFKRDHLFWGRPEEMKMERPAYKIDEEHPGSDLAGEVSAALSSSSLVFAKTNKNYSELLLKHAEELFEFGKQFQGVYQDAIPEAEEFYESTDFKQELCWAAIWLYKATNQTKYLQEAEEYYEKLNPNGNITDRFFYNNKLAAIQLLLYQATNNSIYRNLIESFCNFIIHKQTRTPKGLVFIEEFGTLSHAANLAFICLQAANLNIERDKNVKFAASQIDYMLGSTGRSFVVGYGDNYPKHPLNSASSCPNLPAPCNWTHYKSKQPNPQIIYGALVSGPDANDHFEDARDNFIYTEVTLDYNAGFQAALAGLIYFNSSVI